MGKFNKFYKHRDDRGESGGGSLGGGNFGGRPKFGGHNDGQKQLFPAICSHCGKNCEVPFKPTGERPVFCRDCFKNQGTSSPKFAPRNFGGNNVPRPIGSNFGGQPTPATGSTITKSQFDSLSAKLDKILAMLATTPKAPEAPKVAIVEAKNKVLKKVKTPAKKLKSKKK